jgi:O-antigen ligase
MKKSEPNPVLKHVLLAVLPLLAVVFSFVTLPKTVFVLLLLALLVVWIVSFHLEGFYALADIPLVFLAVGTFIFGKSFSILGFNAGPLPVYMTELLMALSLVLLLIKEKSIAALWRQWQSPLPKGLMPAMILYFLMGSIYVVLGYKANGALALRDITFCHYMVLLVIFLSFMSRRTLSDSLTRLFIPGVVILFIYGLISFFIRVPGASAFRQFIKTNKNTSMALSMGLIIIIGFSFYEYIKKKADAPANGKNRKYGKWLTLFIVWFAFLLLVMSEVRAGWVGLLVSLILMTIFLKKEMKVVLLILVLLAVSLWLIDHFQLTIKKDKLAALKNEVTSMTRKRVVNMAGANIKFRLGIWRETLEKIAEKPILGWGFGVQVDYLIWGKRLSEIAAKGGGTGILPAHNHLLAILHKMGIIGLALFLFINARVFFLGFFYVNKCQSDFNRRFLVAGLAALIYWHGMAFFFDILESPPTGIFLWIILAAIAGIVHLDRGE